MLHSAQSAATDGDTAAAALVIALVLTVAVRAVAVQAVVYVVTERRHRCTN